MTRPVIVSASFSREGAHYSPSKERFWQVFRELADAERAANKQTSGDVFPEGRMPVDPYAST